MFHWHCRFRSSTEEWSNKVLKRIDSDLLTPYGLKSSNKKNETSAYSGSNINRRTIVYYEGAIWPWVMDLYTAASLKYADNKADRARELEDYFLPLQGLLETGMVNYLPEVILAGDEMLHGGMPDFTPSIASLLWGQFLINQAKR